MIGDGRKLGRAGNQRHSRTRSCSMAGSASGGDHDLAAGADAAEAGADVHSGERLEEARACRAGLTMAMRSAAQLNNSPVAKVGTSAAATQVAAKVT